MITSYPSRQKHSGKKIFLFPLTRTYALRRKFLLLPFLFLFYQPALFAQNKYDFPQFFDETGTFFTQPLHWGGSDWLKLGLIGAGTFAAMQADQPIRDAVIRDQGHYYYSVPVVGGRVWGELYTPVALFTLFGAHSVITGDKTSRKIGYEIGQASLYAGAITFLLKGAIGRARPYTGEGRASYHPFTLFSDNFHSMPGGHTTAGMVLSTVLSRNAHSPFLKGLAYVPVAFTFVSRIYQDEHWFSDDLLGAALGYFVATWVVDTHEQGESRVGISSVYPLTVRIILN
jgi:membrane-associated phospholipid phosphatase